MVWVGNIKASFRRLPKLAVASQFWAKTFIAILVREFKDGKHLLGYLVYPPRASMEDYSDSVFYSFFHFFCIRSTLIPKCLCWQAFHLVSLGKYILLNFLTFLQRLDTFSSLQICGVLVVRSRQMIFMVLIICS